MLAGPTTSERRHHAADAVHENVHAHRPRPAGGAGDDAAGPRGGSQEEEELTSLICDVISGRHKGQLETS